MLLKLMNFFGKSKPEKLNPPGNFPERNKIEEWMRAKVEYFKLTSPDKLWYLFCPSMADYLPLNVHAGVSREEFQKHLSCYNELKAQNPEAVVEALNRTFGYSIYNGGPNEDYPK